MTITELRELNKSGFIAEWHSNSRYWLLTHKRSPSYYQAKRGHTRQFRDFDALYRFVSKEGITEIKVTKGVWI